MNKTTIGRKLNTGQSIMIGMLLVCGGLAFWGEHANSRAIETDAQLNGATHRIRNDLFQMNDSLREQLTDPRNDNHATRYRDAENDLTTTIDELQRNCAGREGVVNALNRLIS